MTPDFCDELESLRLIFASTTFRFQRDTCLLDITSLTPAICDEQWAVVLGRPDLPPSWNPDMLCLEFSLRLRIPAAYPAEIPAVEAVDVWWLDTDADLDACRSSLESALEELFEGDVVLFQFLEEARRLVPSAPLLAQIDREAENFFINIEQRQKQKLFDTSPQLNKKGDHCSRTENAERVYDRGIEFAKSMTPSGIVIHHDAPFVDRKSVFQAHFALVSSMEDVGEVHATLYANNKIARATHNIECYRLESPVVPGPEGWIEDHDSDGETAAGGRVHRMFVS